MIVLGITVVQEPCISIMGTQESVRMLYWAKILLCTRCNLRNIGDQATCVRTVLAMEAFDRVEITEPMPIEDDVISPTRLCDAIDWETACLIG